MSYGERLGAGLLGAVLGWSAMIVVAALINTALIGFLIFWPIYGGTFVLAGLMAAFVVAAFPSSSRRRIVLPAAAITILLFSLLPASLIWLYGAGRAF